MSMINVENLVKRYGKIAAVDDISFSVGGGSIFGFLGPNGAGKTTTINILCTLLAPTSGKASINGHDCMKESSEVRKSIGIVFQDSTLDKDLTAYENMLFHAYLYHVPRPEREKRVNDALRFVDLFDRKDDLVKKYSGGMKRRLEVARGLIHRPKVLFLDEPTLGLDPQTRTNLWNFIIGLPKEHGVTIFMTTHYMEEAEVCDRIAVIDRGKIIAAGTPEELKRGIGGDVIYIRTTDNRRARSEIERMFDAVVYEKDDELFLTSLKGDACIPEIIRALGETVVSIRLQRPTLNDVFLKITGREIRGEDVSANDNVKESVRSYRRKFDRG